MRKILRSKWTWGIGALLVVGYLYGRRRPEWKGQEASPDQRIDRVDIISSADLERGSFGGLAILRPPVTLLGQA